MRAPFLNLICASEPLMVGKTRTLHLFFYRGLFQYDCTAEASVVRPDYRGKKPATKDQLEILTSHRSSTGCLKL